MILAAPPVQAPADPTSTYVIMGGAAVMIIYVMTRLTKKKKRDPFDTQFQARGLAQQRSVERQMEGLLVELSNMARQMTAQLDTRAAKLEALIDDADERIARLEAMKKQTPGRPTTFEMPRETPPEPVMAAPAPVAEVVAKVDDMAPAPVIDAQHAEVYRLADEGHDAREIATELGRPSGEIELILALRPRS